jgi:hypothetical protein
MNFTCKCLNSKVSANGVTVLDVRSLNAAASAAAGECNDSSGRSSPCSEHQVVVQNAQGQHYIAVTGKN